MDIPRTAEVRKRRIRRLIYSLVGLAAIAGVTVGLARLKPAAPRVERGMVWPGTVARGDFQCNVDGNGTLIPEQIQWVQAETEGRIERIHVLPGAAVKPDTLLMEMSNPELVQTAFEVEWQLKAAEATAIRLKVQLESEKLAQEAASASLKADYIQSQLEAEADQKLARDGLVANLVMKRSTSKAEDLQKQYEISQKRLLINEESIRAQLAVQQAEVEKLRALLALKRRQVESLRVKAGFEGTLQQVGDREMLQSGQRVLPGATLAKVVQPSKLKAEIKIVETQAKDIIVGLPAVVDTRNGKVPGKVMRVDPAVQNGTVTVDIKLEGELPKGARPDLTVEATIELEHLTNVLYVGRPYGGQPESTVNLFKIVENGRSAIRVPVKLGRSSVKYIEVIQGLQVGDQIILSDMQQWDSHDRVRLN
jgi:HlyD family secretion protein